jgi:hypothetical protein
LKCYNYHEAPITAIKSELQECQLPHYEEFIIRLKTDDIQKQGGIVASDLWKLYNSYCDTNMIGSKIRLQSMNGLSQKVRHLVTTKASKIKGVKYTVYYLNSDIAKAARSEALNKKADEFNNKRLMRLAFNNMRSQIRD